MGKVIQNGFMFMEYVNSGLIRTVDDVPELKTRLIARSESKTHIEMSRYALLLAEHILAAGGVRRSAAIEDCFSVNLKWQNREIKFQAALEVAGELNRLARAEEDPVKTKVLRAMGQVAATPHVRWHPLVASEYAVVMVNLMYPNDLDRVKAERERQIELIESVK